MKRSNKGLSTIIATLIIIMLAFVAVALLWFVIKNLITGGTGQLDLTSKCLEVNVKPTKINNTIGNTYQVTLLRTGGVDEISGVKLIFSNAESETNFIADVSGNMANLEIKTVNVTVQDVTNPNKVESVVYFIDSRGNQQYCQNGESLEF